MKRILPIAILALLAVSATFAHAADERFYIGTYTKKPLSKGIYVGTLDTETGNLGSIVLAGTANNPGYLALSPNGKYLYSTVDSREGGAAAYKVGPDGTLTYINEQSSGNGGACHVSVDATGGNVFVACYGGGSVAAIKANADGSLGERTAFVQFTGSGPDASRQTKPHAHSIYADPTNRFVYTCDLGTDTISIYKLDAEKGTLTPNDPPAAKVPPGAGVRHLAWSPNGKYVYTSNEMGHTTTAFAVDAATGNLTPFQVISTLPSAVVNGGPILPTGVPVNTITTAEVMVHPSGKWLYVSNRYYDSFAVFSIADDGKLTWIQDLPSPVKVPRGFAVDPSGKWLIAGGQDDDKIAVMKIDQTTGKLSTTDQTATIGTPICVLFPPVK